MITYSRSFTELFALRRVRIALNLAIVCGFLALISTPFEPVVKADQSPVAPYSSPLYPQSAADLDATFGVRGKVITPLGRFSDEYISDVAVHADGRIVAIGNRDPFEPGNAHPFVAQYLPDGSFDPGFNLSGILTYQLGENSSTAEAMCIQPDGKILVTGVASTGAATRADMYVLRLTPEGESDPSFGSNGVVFTDFHGGIDRSFAIFVQSDGKIVIGGTAEAPASSYTNYALVRYNTDGSLDTAFGIGGKVDSGIANSGREIHDLKVQNDGKIVACGSFFLSNRMVVLRYNADGARDQSFGTNGEIEIMGGFWGFAVNLQTDGKIIVSGRGTSGTEDAFVSFRLNTNGTMDPTFGIGGKVTTSFGVANIGDDGRDAVLQEDGKLVVGGNVDNRTFALARYRQDGTLDTTFGGTGKVITEMGPLSDYGLALALTPTGKILLGGRVLAVPTANDAGLAQYDQDGSLDMTFGHRGLVTGNVQGFGDTAFGAAILPSGEIFTVGQTLNSISQSTFAVMKYRPDGNLDDTYASRGSIFINMATGQDEAYAAAAQSTGKVVVVGNAGAPNSDFGVVRLNPTGTSSDVIDETFGTNLTGKVITPIGSGPDISYAVAVQPDDKIILAGSALIGSTTDFALLRLNANGTRDTGFGSNGVVTTSVSAGDDTCRSIAIQSDGKVVVAGYSTNGTISAVALARYNADGTLDATFGSGGTVLTPVGGVDDRAFGLALQADGKIVAAGYSRAANDNDLTVLRYAVDGALDPTFGTGGFITAGIEAGSAEVANSVVIQSDGKIVVGGSSLVDIAGMANYNFLLARFNSNGTPDETFGNSGIIVNDHGVHDEIVRSLILQPDKKLVAVGNFRYEASNAFAVLRYKGDSVDPVTPTPTNTPTATPTFTPSATPTNTPTASPTNTPVGAPILGDYPDTTVTVGKNVTVVPSTPPIDTALTNALTTPSFDGLLTVDPSSGNLSITNAGPAGVYVVTVRAFGPLGTASKTFILTVSSAPSCAEFSFSQPIYSGSAFITSMAAADFNLDGIQDMAVTSARSFDNISVLLGDGNGNFYPRSSFTMSAAPGSLAVSDINRDGIPDLLVTNPNFNTFWVIYGTGGGNLGSLDSYSAFQRPLVISVGDLNQDGLQDVVVSNDLEARVRVYLGRAAGGFDAGATLIVGDFPKSILIGDYDRNGNNDLVVVSRAGFVTRYLGNGNGTFGTRADFTVGMGSESGAKGDFNGDGILDIVTANQASNNISVLLGTGTGSFGSAINYGGLGAQAAPRQVAVADFNTDGNSDLVVTSQSLGRISILAGTGTGSFAPPVNLSETEAPNGVVVGDFDQDTKQDFAVLTALGSGSISARKRTCAGTTPTPTATPTHTPTATPTNSPTATPTATPHLDAAEFDYDGDRRSDISVFRPANASWYLQKSSAGFSGVQFGISTDKTVPADFDGDGKTDVAVFRPSTGAWYIINSSDESFSSYAFGSDGDLPAPTDYDGDNKADLAVFRPTDGTWYIRNSSNGTFTIYQFGTSGDRPTIGDFDGDGRSDIALFRPATGAWYQVNSSNGTFFGEQFGISTDKITPADYDGDGKTDIAIYRPSESLWYVKNSSTITYVPYVFGLADDFPVPDDFDGDGRADIGVFRPSDGTWYIVNSTNGSYTIFQFGQNGDQPTQSSFIN